MNAERPPQNGRGTTGAEADAARPVGVLVMAHGTPDSPEAVEAFYTSIRRGRPPTPELLAELQGRYRAIGGLSPLAAITRSQVAGVAAALEARAPGRYLVGYGAKHVEPSIEQGLDHLVGAGARRVVAIVLTPHQSTLGSGSYLARAEEEARTASTPDAPVELVAVASWHRADGLADLLAERTAAALGELPPAARRQATVLFTAHSVPRRALGPGDPYPRQVAESAADVAARLGLGDSPGRRWAVAWQSAGRTADEWLGPDLLGEIARVAEEGARGVVVCPVGFVADHLEILYDLDVEAAGAARGCGVAFTRTASLNDDPSFCDVLAGAVTAADRGPVPAVADG